MLNYTAKQIEYVATIHLLSSSIIVFVIFGHASLKCDDYRLDRVRNAFVLCRGGFHALALRCKLYNNNMVALKNSKITVSLKRM